MRTKKHHWYPDNGKPGRKRGYPKTACGRDGSDVGGLVTFFFRMDINDIENCKVCVHKYKKGNKNAK